jgi:enoyl-CoA hydratase/carnithine racemase
MMVDLADAVEELEKWDNGDGLVVRGATDSSMFCARGYLKIVEKISGRDAIFVLSIRMNQTTEKLSKLPLVSVCLVEGMVVGGGRS